MATTPTITGAVRGIDRDLTGYVIQSEDIDTEKRLHRVPDQKDRTGYEEVVENTRRLQVSVISDGASTDAPPLEEHDFFIYPSTGTMGTSKWRWQVDTCKDAGTYNGDRKWSVTAHRYDNWPPQTENWTPSQAAAASSGTNGSGTNGSGTGGNDAGGNGTGTTQGT